MLSFYKYPVRQNQIWEKIQFTGIMIIVTLPVVYLQKFISLPSYLSIFLFLSDLFFSLFFFMYSWTLVKFQVRQV